MFGMDVGSGKRRGVTEAWSGLGHWSESKIIFIIRQSLQLSGKFIKEYYRMLLMRKIVVGRRDGLAKLHVLFRQVELAHPARSEPLYFGCSIFNQNSV